MNKDDEVQEWEAGLITPAELIPITQTLITPDLATAFRITPEPATSAADIQIASENTFAALRRQGTSSPLDAHPTSPSHENFNLASGIPYRPTENGGPSVDFSDCGHVVKGLHLQEDGGHVIKDLNLDAGLWDQGVDQISNYQHRNSTGYGDSFGAANGMAYVSSERRAEEGYGSGIGGADSSECGGGGLGKKLRKRLELEFEDADSSACLETSSEEPAARTLKRPRLVWTPQLHKRFVDAVAHLGIKNAVPKTIMQLMNVEGLTRENVASHLQKYRLYLKRMQGLSSEGPSVSDQLFASTPVPPAHFFSNNGEDLIPLLMPMQMAGGIGHGHMVGPLGPAVPYPSFDHHLYNALARTTSQRLAPGDQDYLMDIQGRQGSPEKRALTLFPSSGH